MVIARAPAGCVGRRAEARQDIRGATGPRPPIACPSYGPRWRWRRVPTWSPRESTTRSPWAHCGDTAAPSRRASCTVRHCQQMAYETGSLAMRPVPSQTHPSRRPWSI